MLNQRRVVARIVVTAGLFMAGCTGRVGPNSEDGLPLPGKGMPGVDPGKNPGKPDDPVTTPGDPGPRPGDPMTMPGALVASPRFSRLSHAQWENAVRDLLRLDATTNLSGAFIRDPIDGFDNAADLLEVSPELRVDYERAAEELASRVAGNAAQLAKLIPADAPKTGAGRADAFIRDLGRRAHRQPLTDAEVAEYRSLFDAGPMLGAGTDDFAAGASLVLRAVLQSPFFLYRTELGTEVKDGRIALSSWESAAKLAFALTNTMPDDALFAAAMSNKLSTAAGVEAEARRVLGTPAAAGVVESFGLQLLEVPKYESIGVKDAKTYPAYAAIQPRIAADAKRETLTFMREIFTKDLGLTEMLTAPFSFVNATLAKVYGLSGTFPADEFVRADLNPAERAGILTHVGFLAARAGSVQPDPIHRGLFVIENLICGYVPPPLPNVTPPTAEPGKTNRQNWEAKTHQGACKQCHADLINPVGFAFEGYDAIGGVRTMDNGQMIDATGFYKFESGERSYNGAVEMAKAISDTPEVRACFARHWLEYTLGRALKPGDDPDVARLAMRISEKGSSMRGLLLDIVTSPAFLTRAP